MLFYVNPKRPPHSFLAVSRAPSPNFSFHLRSSVRLPRDSDAEGLISLRAVSKCRSESTRARSADSADNGAAAAPSKPVVSIGGCNPYSVFHGIRTTSLTASSAADTQRSYIRISNSQAHGNPISYALNLTQRTRQSSPPAWQDPDRLRVFHLGGGFEGWLV
jgi:hypothetical protein